jgi:hypothetical protein
MPYGVNAWSLQGNKLLNPDFRDTLSTFNEHGVEFLVVGGYAMAAHRLPRATNDLDLWVRSLIENAPQSGQEFLRLRSESWSQVAVFRWYSIDSVGETF